MLDFQVEALHLDDPTVNQGFHFLHAGNKGVVTDYNCHLLNRLTRPIHCHDHLDYGALIDLCFTNYILERFLVGPVIDELIELEVESACQLLLFSHAHILLHLDQCIRLLLNELDGGRELF